MTDNSTWVTLKELIEVTGLSRQWIWIKEKQGVIRIKPKINKLYNLEDAKNHWGIDKRKQ